MTHYQKIATMAFRVIGSLLLVVGVLAALIGLILSVSFFRDIGLWIAVFYSIPLTVFGVAIFSLSKTLGKLVCFDFDRFGDA